MNDGIGLNVHSGVKDGGVFHMLNDCEWSDF